jgi:predicted nucleic acid-binding Zn ribbon protein
MSAKRCPQCQKPIAGRSDKKYCSNDCRSLANREKQRIAHQPSVIINQILWNNREALRTLWMQRPTMVSRDTLLSNGYNFHFHTNLHITARGNVYYVCYDFGFQPCMVSGTKMALVVKMISNATRDVWDTAMPNR